MHTHPLVQAHTIIHPVCRTRSSCCPLTGPHLLCNHLDSTRLASPTHSSLPSPPVFFIFRSLEGHTIPFLDSVHLRMVTRPPGLCFESYLADSTSTPLRFGHQSRSSSNFISVIFMKLIKQKNARRRAENNILKTPQSCREKNRSSHPAFPTTSRGPASPPHSQPPARPSTTAPPSGRDLRSLTRGECARATRPAHHPSTGVAAPSVVTQTRRPLISPPPPLLFPPPPGGNPRVR